MLFRHPLAILNWPAPNYVDPERRAPFIYGINGFVFGMATLAIILRLYARVVVRRWFGWDDGLILLGWFFSMCDLTTVFFAYSHYGWSGHMWDTRPESLEPGAKSLMVAKLFWGTASATIRLSVIVLYYRLLNHIDMNNYRWVLHISTFYCIGIGCCFFFANIFVCVPVSEYWHWPSLGRCIDEGMATTVLSGLNTLSEFLVAALPIPIILQFDLSRRQQFHIACLLCLGFFVGIVGIVRTYIVWILFDSDDLTWWAAPHFVCAQVEICLSITCASLPAIRPLLGRFFADRKPLLKRMKLRRDSTQIEKSETSTTAAQSQTQNPYSTYSTYWKTIDVEGIGIDGYGYTVTVTADAPSERRKSKLRKSMVKEDDVEMNVIPKNDTSKLQQPKQWVSQWMRRQGFHRPLNPIHQPIEITTTRSLEVLEEVAPRDSFEDSTRPTRFAPLPDLTIEPAGPEKTETRIYPPSDLRTPLPAKTGSAPIRAPVPMRRISSDFRPPRFSNVAPGSQAHRDTHGTTGVRTFFYESDDEDSFHV